MRVFHGGGVELLEHSIKGRGDDSLGVLAEIAAERDDGEPPDLTGLSCRWAPIKSAHGKMVSLVIKTRDHGAIHAELARIAGIAGLHAISAGALKARWPPKGLMREVRARRGKKSLPVVFVKVALGTLLAFVCSSNTASRPAVSIRIDIFPKLPMWLSTSPGRTTTSTWFSIARKTVSNRSALS